MCRPQSLSGGLAETGPGLILDQRAEGLLRAVSKRAHCVPRPSPCDWPRRTCQAYSVSPRPAQRSLAPYKWRTSNLNTRTTKKRSTSLNASPRRTPTSRRRLRRPISRRLSSRQSPGSRTRSRSQMTTTTTTTTTTTISRASISASTRHRILRRGRRRR